jgi:uncharacterized sulfatase
MRITTVAILTLLTLSSWCRAETKPNVVLIISDDQGWTDYGFMGHKQVQTPHLDKLASQSLVFKRGYVPSSLCCPSLASIITGQYPHQHKITGNDPPTPAGTKRGDAEFDKAFRAGRDVMTKHMEEAPALPRLLAANGYLSLQTGKWWQNSYKSASFTHGMSKGDRHGDEGLKIGRETMAPLYDFIAQARKEEKPFFVWYAPMLPHEPHNAPKRFFDKYKDKAPSAFVARYWANVEWFDETCGQLLEHLDKQGLAENTIVLYVTDNGWLQNEEKRGPIRSKLTPYDLGVRTPIMIRWPGKVKPAQSQELAMSIDLAPTILTAAGLKPPKEMPGVNLLNAEAVARRKTIYGECFKHDIGDLNNPAKGLLWRWMIDGRWKLIVPADARKEVELYDILADEHEKTDVAAKNGEVVRNLRDKLDTWWKPQCFE